MLINPKVGQEILFTSLIRGIDRERATVIRSDEFVVIQLNDVGTTLFVELGDELIHVRGYQDQPFKG